MEVSIEKAKSLKASPEMMDAGCACRQSARGVLQDMVRRAEGEVNALHILNKVIPWELLSRQDEEILWDYFCKRR